MRLDVNVIEKIGDYQTQYIRFKTGKRCWNWDETVEAIVIFTDGFDLYLNEMTEEERNDAQEVGIQMSIYAQNTIAEWMDTYKDYYPEQVEFSRWLQIENGHVFGIEDVAEILKISTTTVRNKIKKLGIIKPGDNKFGKWEFCRDEFDHLIDIMSGGDR